MFRRSGSAWVHALLVAVPTSILSCLGTALLLRPEPPLIPAAVSDAGEVVRRLDELQRQLGVRIQEATRVIARSAGQARQPVTDRSPDIERMESSIDRLSALLASARPAAVGEPIPRHLPVNHAKLGELHALANQDTEAAKRSTLLLTAPKVAGRFGFPNDVGANGDGTMFWNYYHFGPNGQRDGGTCFNFMDGRVVYYDISISSR